MAEDSNEEIIEITEAVEEEVEIDVSADESKAPAIVELKRRCKEAGIEVRERV